MTTPDPDWPCPTCPACPRPGPLPGSCPRPWPRSGAWLCWSVPCTTRSRAGPATCPSKGCACPLDTVRAEPATETAFIDIDCTVGAVKVPSVARADLFDGARVWDPAHRGCPRSRPGPRPVPSETRSRSVPPRAPDHGWRGLGVRFPAGRDPGIIGSRAAARSRRLAGGTDRGPPLSPSVTSIY